MTKQILVTHSDFDGAACAVVFKTWFPDGVYYSENYDTVDNRIRDILEDSLPDELYIADISPQDQQVISLLTFVNQTTSCKVFLFDHHKTAMGLAEYGYAAKIDLSICGAQLMYDWLTDNKFDYLSTPMPNLTPLSTLVWHANDYDLWIHQHPLSNTLNQLLRSIGFDRFVTRFTDDPSPQLRPYEKLLIELEQEKQDQYIQEVIEHSTEWFSDSQDRSYALCFAEQYHSQLGHTILEDQDLEHADYVIMVDLKNRRVGLRSRQNGVDVSEIAKAFDGGGHQAAAGFQLSPLILAQLNELLFGKDSES